VLLVIKKKLPKVSNCLKGKNLPNPVTLNWAVSFCSTPLSADIFSPKKRHYSTSRCMISMVCMLKWISLHRNHPFLFWDRDRFYKTKFRPKTFRINFHPKILDKLPIKTNICICIGRFTRVDNNIEFWNNLKPRMYKKSNFKIRFHP
jgi:hypothetical protein